MELIPELTIQYELAHNNQFGLVTQPTHVTGDKLDMLMGSSDVIRAGLYFEPNTGTIILDPSLRPIDFGLSQTTQSGTGKFRTDQDRSTHFDTIVQYDATADVAWNVTSTANVIEIDNAGFSVDLYLGAAPKATTDRTATGIYRQVTWAAGSASGENRWRVTIPYLKSPYLERSINAGSTWTREAILESSANLSTLWGARTTRTTLTVMVIAQKMVVWLGEGFKRGGEVVTKNATYKAGTVRIDGKGGYTGIGFSKVRHEKTGYFISYRHFGPADMTTPTPTVYFHGTTATELTAASQTRVGIIEARYSATTEFTYRVTMTSPAAAAPDATYSATTPYIEQINIVWPLIYTPPAVATWTDLAPLAYEEQETFDPATRVLRRYNKLTARIYAGEQHPVHGVDALRVYLGYQHERLAGTPPTLRGYFIGGTEARLYSMGRDSFIDYEGHDLLWLLEDKAIPRRFFPSRWCIYSVVRLLLEMGGIVPDFYQTFPKSNDGVHFCDFGENPSNCPGITAPGTAGTHAIIPAHPGWEETTPILPILDELKDVIFAWYGQTADGQFHFETFDPTSYTTIGKAFTEQGSAAGDNYDEIGQPGGATLQRTRSLSGVKNSITFTGIDQVSGVLIAKTWRDDASIYDRGAMNYVGSIRPYMQASSLFLDAAYTQAALDKTSKWVRLPYDDILLPVNGQPSLFPTVESGKLISAKELRALGPLAIPYLVHNVTHRFDAPGVLRCWISGLWNGVGVTPGYPDPVPAHRRSQGQVTGGNGSIPAGARSNTTAITTRGGGRS